MYGMVPLLSQVDFMIAVCKNAESYARKLEAKLSTVCMK
jgi:hypothetical protein